MFLGMSKYESTSYLCTLFDIQCCQSVIRKLVYGFMCRLDSYVNYIIHGIGPIQVLRNADGGGGWGVSDFLEKSEIFNVISVTRGCGSNFQKNSVT